MMNRSAMRAALRASSRATVRPAISLHSALVDVRYRMQLSQVKEMMGEGVQRKEGVTGRVIGCIGSALGWAFGLVVFFHVLSRI